jgi:20S proteasome subunit alpha 3
MEVKDVIALVLRVTSKTVYSTTLGSEKFAFFILVSLYILHRSIILDADEPAVLTLNQEAKRPKVKFYKPVGVDALLKSEELGKQQEATEMKSPS